MTVKTTVAAMAALVLAGCMNVDDTASRNAPIESTFDSTVAQAAQAHDYAFSGFSVNVPQTLRVSEANFYYPSGDIVWREDPMGDRRVQVEAIVSAAARKALADAKGSVPAIAEIEIIRFHALTEKARYTTGGWHSVDYTLTIRHAESGEVLVAPRNIKTSITAYGGARALAAEARGITQKVRITDMLVDSLRKEALGLGPAPKVVVAPAVTAQPVVQPL